MSLRPQTIVKIATMPGKKNNKSAKNRRGVSNKASMAATTVTIPHRVVDFPYAAIWSMTESVAGGGAYYTFTINDPYDPNFTGAGSQPVGFDQWAQFYGRFRTVRFKFTMDIANVTGTANPVKVGIYFSPQSTLPAVPAAWFVQPTVGRQTKLLSSTTGSAEVCRLTGSVDIWDVFGVTKREFMDEADFASTFSGGPARVAYMHVFCLSSVAAATVRVYPELHYITELSQPVALSVS